MATFTLTILNVNPTGGGTDLRQGQPRIIEQLRNCADELTRQSQINLGGAPTPFTKLDGYGNTVYSWSIA